jgi:nucleoside-diphosphate-sugar epimerase
MPAHGGLDTYTSNTLSLFLTMSAPKKFVVFTATGAQGSSVCRYLLKEGYHVVGLTRNPESAGAKGTSRNPPVST